MKDLMLGQNNNLVWDNGDLALVEGLDMIKQHIVTGLYTLLGDWLLDDREGINFDRNMRNEVFWEHDIKKVILSTNGVLKIKQFKMIKEKQNIKILAYVHTNYGDIELNEVIRS